MKTAFQRRLTRTVTLIHGSKDDEEQVELVLNPAPPGYRAYVATMFPDPVLYVNGKPGGVNTALLPRAEFQRAIAWIAKLLGDQMETQPPTGSAPDLWQAYAENVEREFERAGFTEGDILAILAESNKMERGAGSLGNSSGGLVG